MRMMLYIVIFCLGRRSKMCTNAINSKGLHLGFKRCILCTAEVLWGPEGYKKAQNAEKV